MSAPCLNCGNLTKVGQSFCPRCGSPVLHATTTPIEADPPSPLSQVPAKTLIFGAIGLVGLFVAAWLLTALASKDGSAGTTDPDAAASANPDAPRPQEWFDSYADTFVSAEMERLVTGPAQKRNFPTVRGSRVTGSVEPGTIVSGRLVEGGDANSKWLKTGDGSYIWDGNLAAPETITSLGMNRFRADIPFSRIATSFKSDGRYSSSDPSWEVYACEIYTSQDGLVDAMVIEGKVTRFETDSPQLTTANGVRVGSSEGDLLRAYGKGKLKKETNPYAGVDYFYWVGGQRGIKFNVENGKVTLITAGSESIRFVEGCL